MTEGDGMDEGKEEDWMEAEGSQEKDDEEEGHSVDEWVRGKWRKMMKGIWIWMDGGGGLGKKTIDICDFRGWERGQNPKISFVADNLSKSPIGNSKMELSIHR